MKMLIKMFMPSGKKLAGYAAEGIQKAVNGYTSDKKEVVGKYADYANQVAAISARLTHMMNDGTLDDAETDELQEMLAPVFDKALALI